MLTLRHLVFVSMLAALVQLAGCSATGTLNALTSRDTYTLKADQPYGTLSRQKLDIYTPVSAAPAGGFPLVVFFYGGSWNSGSRSEYRFFGEALAARGVIAVVADYRLYPEVQYPAFLDDSASAVAYALAHAEQLGADPKRIFVMGHSAGGYNAAMVAIDPRWLAKSGHSPSELAGFIGLAGPYDFLPTDNPMAQGAFRYPDYPQKSQPVEHVADAPRAAPPTFLGYAPADRLVSPEINTLALADKLKQAKVPFQLKAYDRTNHMTLMGAFARPLRFLAPVLDDVVGFIQNPATASPG